ncbi:hypothetical protein [Pseudomonas sp. PSE14]|uniref:hypothetical protein n=1 Tax=Pseudomonas sp. PSE14 TaxID=3016341 RepID=UPI0023D7F073|nr:hypothetical protein [Pseudomonas sp. PSE14]WEJ71775.1 hypothetical protein O6P39_24505 [Pseudomonas sp. PSE14]
MTTHSPTRPRLLHVLLSLLSTVIGLTCMVHLLSPDSADALPAESPLRIPTQSLSAAPIYSEPSAEAFEHVDQYLKLIDKAMIDGLAVLRGGDGPSIASQSRYFNALVNAGYAQFGSSYQEPLGSCGAAGSSARSLWHAQIRTVSGPRQEDPSGEVRKALLTLQQDREACLLAARLVPDEPLRWAPATLSALNLIPAWSNAAPWPEIIAERTSTNL